MTPYRDLVVVPKVAPPGPIDDDLRPASRFRSPLSMQIVCGVTAVPAFLALYALHISPALVPLLAFFMIAFVGKQVDRLVFAPRAARQFNGAAVPLLEKLGRGQLEEAEGGFRMLFHRFAGRGGLQAVSLFNIAAIRARRGDTLGALRILLELQQYPHTKRAPAVAHKLATTIALHYAQLGEVTEARNWLAIGHSQKGVKVYAGNVDAMILMREGRWKDAEAAFEREWPDLERMLGVPEMRALSARRAFGLEQSGADAAQVQRLVEAARPSRSGELIHVGAGWDELRAFLERHGLV